MDMEHSYFYLENTRSIYFTSDRRAGKCGYDSEEPESEYDYCESYDRIKGWDD